jgi:hypothetical protein
MLDKSYLLEIKYSTPQVNIVVQNEDFIDGIIKNYEGHSLLC